MGNTQASQQAPSLPDTFRLALEAHANQLRVALPGKILAYNPRTHKAKVQPLIQYRQEGGETRTLAPISGVPVIHPRSSAGGVYLPLATGDMVTLLMSDRNLDSWKAGSGQKTLPKTFRAHDLADCWAIPGGYPDGKAPKPRYPGSLELWLAPGKGLAISNPTDNLVDLLVQIIGLLLTDTHGGNLGFPTTPPQLQVPQWNILKAQLEAFKP